MSLLEWLEVFVLICIGLMMLGCAGLASVLMYCLAVSSKRGDASIETMSKRNKGINNGK